MSVLGETRNCRIHRVWSNSRHDVRLWICGCGQRGGICEGSIDTELGDESEEEACACDVPAKGGEDECEHNMAAEKLLY